MEVVEETRVSRRAVSKNRVSLMAKVDNRAALEWLASGDCGISSKCLVYAALGMFSTLRWFDQSPPYDPSDLGRCLRMLKLMPWVRELAWPTLAASPRWKRVLDNWDKLAESMQDEVGIDWSKGQSAPKTYALMKEIEHVG